MQDKIILNFYDQPTWDRIITGKKTIETRALNPYEPERYFGDIQYNQIIVFMNENTGEQTQVKIIEIYRRDNLEEYIKSKPEILLGVHPHKIINELNTLEKIIPLFSFTDDYVEKINTFGLVGRRFEIVHSKSSKNLAFAGGSSGGHVVPISSLIQYIQKIPATSHQPPALFWFGERNSLEENEAIKLQSYNAMDLAGGLLRQNSSSSKLPRNVATARAGNNGELEDALKHRSTAAPQLKFVTIVSGKFRRQANREEWIQNIIDIFKFSRGVVQSFYYLKKYKIDVIFSKGGFVSLPVVIAGWLARIKIVVHESDTKPGIATRIASKFATKVFTGFPSVLPGAEYVGQILSDAMLPATSNQLPATNHHSINQKHSSKVSHKHSNILVNCGSLGSASVHEALLKLFSDYPNLTQDFHWTVLLGKLNAGFKMEYERYSDVVVYDYIDQKKMGELYMQTDISICRGGSTSLVEQHLFGIRQIIIPIPRTHDQASNAQFFVKEYGDVMLDQNEEGWEGDLLKTLSDLKDRKKTDIDIEMLRQGIVGGKEKIIRELM